MKSVEAREAFYGRLNKWLMAAYLVLHIGLGIYNVVLGYPYFYIMAFCWPLFIPVVSLFYKVFRIKPVQQLNTIIYGFIFLSYSIGVVMYGYHIIPSFDKVCHMLSGTFTGILGIVMYYLLKPGRRAERSDGPMCIVFMLCFALAIAGFWEICEFTLSPIAGMDLQNVAASGVTDTMTDMIVCLIGALLIVPSMLRFYRKGHADFIMGAVESFCEINLGGTAGISGGK